MKQQKCLVEFSILKMFRCKMPYILGILLQRYLETTSMTAMVRFLSTVFYKVILASIYWKLTIYQILFLTLCMYYLI